MSVDIELATQEVAKFVVAQLDYPPEVAGMKVLGKSLARFAKSKEHAALVVDAWIDKWPQWPKPSEIVQLCQAINDPANVKRVAAPGCEFCNGIGWEERQFTLRSGIFAGESVSAVTRCRCGGMPPTPRSEENFNTAKRMEAVR